MKLFSSIKNTKSSMYDLNKYVRTAPGISTMYEVDLSGFADFTALNKKWDSKFSDLKKEKLLHHYKNDDKMFFVFSVINTTLRDDYFDDDKEVEGYTFPILGKLEPRWHSEFRLSREYSEEVLSQSKATHYVNEIREDIKLLKDHYSDIMKYYQEVWDIVKKSV